MKTGPCSWLLACALLVVPNAHAEEPPAVTPPTQAQDTSAPHQPSAAPGEQALVQAKRAETRRQQAQSAGDGAAAQRWVDVVQRWKHVVTLFQQAAAVAQQAAMLEKRTAELTTQARRARNLLEQTEVRRARALGELQRLGIAATPPASPQAETAPPAPSPLAPPQPL